MDVSCKKLILMLLLFFSSSGFSDTIGSCLNDAHKKTHVIDQHQAIETCFRLNRNSITQQQCFNSVNELSKSKKYYDLIENLNSICFYETTAFSEFKSCLNRTSQFKIADNHDEAIFDCYRQFQNQLSQKQCIEASRKMIYPAKKDYLFQHCQSNP